MTCPVCGTEGAYIGLLEVDCPNPTCRHFKALELPGEPLGAGLLSDVARMIDQEDHSCPLTDDELAWLLSRSSRASISKWDVIRARKALRIPSPRLRRVLGP